MSASTLGGGRRGGIVDPELLRLGLRHADEREGGVADSGRMLRPSNSTMKVDGSA